MENQELLQQIKAAGISAREAEKNFKHLLKTTETNLEKVGKHMGLYIALIEAASFQYRKFSSFLERTEKQQLGALDNGMGNVITRHRLAEKKANPEGYDTYEEKFDISAAMIIDTLEAMRKGQLEIVDSTQTVSP